VASTEVKLVTEAGLGREGKKKKKKKNATILVDFNPSLHHQIPLSAPRSFLTLLNNSI
jgi:hypothetical protein